jgi:NAD(P)-dependent dehydrogenase (short-subunit alcohol dehydrogenase family)
VQQTVDRFGGLDVLVNNAAEQHVQEDVMDIPKTSWKRHFAPTFSATSSWRRRR